jgi:hypothetical protein
MLCDIYDCFFYFSDKMIFLSYLGTKEFEKGIQDLERRLQLYFSNPGLYYPR